MAYDNTAERKIYFYRVVSQDPTKARGWKLDRAALAKAIMDLAGTSDFYLVQENGDRVTCAEVHSDRAPQQIKFYAIRRRDLPSLDSGTGTIGDLDLEETEGLAEAVHVCLFPNGVIGFEAFYHGPRISRVEDFLNERCAEALGCPIAIRQLYRGDMVTRALKFKDTRVFHVKLHPSKESREAAKKAGLTGVMQTANAFGAGVWAEVRLRAEKDDQNFTSRVKGVFKGWKEDGVDPSEFMQAVDIEGVNPESDRVEPLNVLSDALVRVAYIPRKSERSRALDSGAAFDAVREAYKKVADHLPSDALGA